MKQKLIRLKELSAYDVREDLRTMLTRQIRLICMLCDDHPEPELNEETRDLANKLHSYALTGEPRDVPLHNWGILDRALYSSTVDFSLEAETWPKTSAMSDLEDAPPPIKPLRLAFDRDPMCSIECVMRATLARRRLEDGLSVPPGWLATLGSISAASIRVYISRGELTLINEIDGTKGVENASAIDWLKKRGVEGL